MNSRSPEHWGPVVVLLMVVLIAGAVFVGRPSSTSVSPKPVIATTAVQQSWVWRNPYPQGSPLAGVQCPSARICIAVGDNGAILTSADGGIHWTNRVSPTSGNLLSVSCPSVYDCLAVGENGVIVRGDGGARWAVQHSGTVNRLIGVSCPSVRDCIAVGDKGSIVQWLG